MRSRSLLAARSRHPTQVRSGQARACVRPDMSKSTSPRCPHPFGAMVERLLAKKTRLISARSVVPRRRTSRAPGGVDRRRPAATDGGRRVMPDGRIPCGRRIAGRDGAGSAAGVWQVGGRPAEAGERGDPEGREEVAAAPYVNGLVPPHRAVRRRARPVRCRRGVAPYPRRRVSPGRRGTTGLPRRPRCPPRRPPRRSAPCRAGCRCASR